MTEYERWKSELTTASIPFVEHADPPRLECSRTVAVFDAAGRFLYWEAKDAPLVMVRADENDGDR